MSNDALFTASTDAYFTASPDTQFAASLNNIEGLTRLVLRGVCLDTSVNRNNWQIPEDELAGVANNLINAQIRIDHSQSIRDVKGRILKTEVDQPHTEFKESWDHPNIFPHIHYEAEIITNDASILIPIIHGYVDHGSIGVDSKTVFCSTCGELTRPGKQCDCDNSWELVRNPRVNEYSIVCSPAYSSTVFVPFASSEKSDECEDKKCKQKLEIEKEIEIASVESEDIKEIASEIKEDDIMGEEDNKFDSLIAAIDKVLASNAELAASNKDLLSRIEAIEAEELKASKDDEKEEEEDEKEASEEEASEEEEKEACGGSKKKASKKKASNGMKDTPGERGDPPGEEKKEVKKSPIEAAVISESNFKSNEPVNNMEKAVTEIFNFAAKCDVHPL